MRVDGRLPTGTAYGPPYGAYALIFGSFLGGMAMVAIGTRRHADRPYSALDIAMLALATFKSARTLARDEVTSFIREPFVEGTPANPRTSVRSPPETSGRRSESS